MSELVNILIFLWTFLWREEERENKKQWNIETPRYVEIKKRGNHSTKQNTIVHQDPPTQKRRRRGVTYTLFYLITYSVFRGRVYEYITHSSSYFSYFSSAWFKFGVLSVVWKYAFFFSMRVGSRGSLPPWLPVRLVRVFSARSSPLLRGSRFRRLVPFLPHSWTLI